MERRYRASDVPSATKERKFNYFWTFDLLAESRISASGTENFSVLFSINAHNDDVEIGMK